MLNPNAKLNPDLFDQSKLAVLPTRDGFGVGLVEAGKADVNIVGLTADLSESTRMDGFQKAFPERFIEMGVAEQNMITVASGLANYGKIPFATSYGAFSPGRNWEQIRTTIALNNVPVKIVGCHAGLTVGPDGATHQMLEDIALMRSMPNMIVVVPADANEAKRATLAIAHNGKPSYLRLGREKTPVFTTNETPFEIGKAVTVFGPFDGHGNAKPSQDDNSNIGDADVGIIACGNLVYPAILAAQELGNEGINATVINLHTVKPIDREAIISLAKIAGAIVTAEEHQIMGGMGSAVAEVLAEEHPVPIEFVGMRDTFGQSGKPDELMKHYKLDKEGIMVAARDAVRRK